MQLFCKSQPILQSCWFRGSSAVGEGPCRGQGTWCPVQRRLSSGPLSLLVEWQGPPQGGREEPPWEARFTRFPGDLEQVTTARAPRTEGAWTAASRGPSDRIAQTTPRPPGVPRAACAQPRGLCPLPGSSRLRGAGFGAFWLWSRRGLSQARGHFLQKWEEQENCEQMEKAQSPGGNIGWVA